VSDSIHSLMFAISIAEPHGAPSVLRPASDEIRLVVETRVLLAVTMPPALPSFGYVLVRCDLLGSCSVSINASGAGGLRRLSRDSPDEACQLAGDRGGDHGRWLARPRQLAIPPAQSFLCLPCGIADRLGQTFLPQ
jgi:hypothetical protein